MSAARMSIWWWMCFPGLSQVLNSFKQVSLPSAENSKRYRAKETIIDVDAVSV